MTRLGPAAACELGAGANCAAVAGSRGRGFASRQRHASALCAALIAATLLAGCGGGSSVQIGEPPSGPTISGQVSMPNGTVASAPSLLQRLALQVVARVEALVAGNVEPVGSGVDVRLVRIDNGNIVDGQIRGGSLVGRVSTDADGRFSIRMPARTSPETCRFYLEVGDNGNRSLTRAFVYATDVDINFESETTVRLLLDQIKAGATTLCDLTAGDIQLVTAAVVASDRQVFGDTAAAINSSAAVVAAADPAVQAAIQAAVGAPTAIPTSTITRTPRATASATRTGAAPTATTSVVPPPTRTATTVPTETQRPPTRTATTGEATATATSEEAATATATATAVVTDTAGPTNTVAATNTATPTDTALPTNTAAATNTAEATATLTPEVSTLTPTTTPTDTVAPTGTVAPTDTVTPTNTVEATNTAGPTNTAVPTGTASATITATPTDTGTAGVTQTATATPTDTGTAGIPPTATATGTITNTVAATATATVMTNTPVATNTATALASSTPVVTSTATATVSNTPAATNTAGATNTNTPAATSTASATSTPPATSTATRTLTATATRTATATATRTATATATRTATGTPTPTATVGVICPLTSGIYTTTQLTGGTLDVYNFAPFPFPSGGTIVQHVGAGNVNCVHNTVVPFPGGFTSPNFCVPALMFTTSVTQTGCGVGRIDSNGGSDFTTNEVADTSDAGCGLKAAMCINGNNKGIRADVTVGNAAADTCSSGGTANALVTIPVHTISWSDQSGGTYLGCPGDGTFNGTDMVAAEFDQILDFTTDTATGKWMDLDADGCILNGFGPAAGYTKSGVCIDIGLGTITAVAVGEFGATGGLFDGTFATVLPSTFAGPSGAASATCGSAPPINFNGGTVTRCIP